MLKKSKSQSEEIKALFRPREEELQEKWGDVAKIIPVNHQQHSFDSAKRQKEFIESQFSTEEEKKRYAWYRDEWYRRAKEFDPGPAPLAVGIELVSSCNLVCSMCYTISEEFQNSVVGGQRMLPWETVTSIIDECVEIGVVSILFSWRGESTMYKSKHNDRTYRFTDALKYAREKGILEVSSLTNGQLIDEKMAGEIVEAEPNWINFSIDGLGETYNKIRKIGGKESGIDNAFDNVIANIRRLVKIRDAKGKTRPQIRTNTVYPCIADDPKKYYDFMTELGVGWVTVNEILDFRGSGIDGDVLPDDAVIENWACQYPFQRLMISANGIIVPCTGAHNEESSLVMGRYKGTPPKVVKNIDGTEAQINVPERTLLETWRSAKLEGIRRVHKMGERKKINPGCRNCRHGAVKYGVDWVPEDWDMETMEWIGRKFRNG